MKHLNCRDVAAETVEAGATGVSIRWLITDKDGAPNFSMRHFEVAPGGSTPHHSHAWEHEVYIVGGVGVVVGPEGEEPVAAGDFVFVPPEEKHCFRNPGAETLNFICLIPNQEK